MTGWEVLRRQVAIGGAVCEPSGAGAPGAEVCIRQKTGSTVRDRFCTRPDGTYYFLDLPDGEYVVSARLRQYSAEAEAAVSRDEKGTIRMIRLDLSLSEGKPG